MVHDEVDNSMYSEVLQLHFMRQERVLDDDESRTATELTRHYEITSATLICAQTAALFLHRGYDVSSLLKLNE